MTGTDILRWLHFLSLFVMTAGLGAVMVPLWRGWREEDVDRQLTAFEDATTAHKALLLPGTLAVGATGVFLAAHVGDNFFTTGWLLALELIYLGVLFVCIPILGHTLNRVQVERVVAHDKRIAVDLDLSRMEEAEAIPGLKTTIFYDHDMRRDPAWMDRVVASLGDPVYITVDVDAFDPAIMPSTGTPEPGGLSWYEATTLLRRVFAARTVVGCDLVELCPIPPLVAPNFLCAKLVYKMLGYRSVRR